jgi:hypothetical protein
MFRSCEGEYVFMHITYLEVLNLCHVHVRLSTFEFSNGIQICKCHVMRWVVFETTFENLCLSREECSSLRASKDTVLYIFRVSHIVSHEANRR